jgi:hypothetical protein
VVVRAVGFFVVVVSVVGCGGCPEVNCDPGAFTVFSFDGREDIAAAEVCFNEDCAPVALETYNAGERSDVPMVRRDHAEAGIEAGERFEVRVRAFDADGVLVAEFADTRHRKTPDDCGCEGFGYRWNGEGFGNW